LLEGAAFHYREHIRDAKFIEWFRIIPREMLQLPDWFRPKLPPNEHLRIRIARRRVPVGRMNRLFDASLSSTKRAALIAKDLREHHGINVNPITIQRDLTALADEDMRASTANISVLNELPLSLHLSNRNVCPDFGRPSDPRSRQGFTNASGIEKHDGSQD
jgi:hypothetical protein